MTQEEVQKKTQEKVTAVEILCRQLELVVSAEEMITPQGFIRRVVYYTDTEKYEMADVANKLNKVKDEAKTKTKKTA